MHWSVSPAGPVHPAALIHTQQLYAALLETMAFAENRIQEGIFFFCAKKTTTEVQVGRNSAAGGLPPLRLAKFQAESN